MALILVVDDERDACQLMRRILTSLGHEVEAFQDAEEAVEWLNDNTPDLAVLDIRLRGTDGLSVFEHMRSRRPQSKALLITGCPSADTADKAMALGIEDYLVKPVEIDEFEQRVKKALTD